MCDCRFGVSPVNYPDPDPEGKLTIKCWMNLGPNSIAHIYIYVLVAIKYVYTSLGKLMDKLPVFVHEVFFKSVHYIYILYPFKI